MIGSQPPEGFHKDHLPLVKVQYFDPWGEKVEWCTYDEVKAKYVKEMLDYMISHTTFIEPTSNVSYVENT